MTGFGQAASAGAVAESVFGTDDRVRVSDTTGFPWRAIGRVTIATEAGVFLGTGFLVGPHHMLTAGHVVHSAAYGGDGWAGAITVAFGKDGALEPFGRVAATAMRAPEGWTAGGLAGEDWALVTLDRSIGAALGSFPLFAHPAADFFDATPVTLAGYPGDLGGQAMYAASGPILAGTADRLFYNGTLDTAGGQSGAPVWRSFSGTGTRQAIGIHTTGVLDPAAPGAANGATRLTVERIALIAEWIGQDAVLRPPVDRPDLVDADAAFGSALATISATTVAAGGTLVLTLAPRNMGTAPAAGYAITVYASTNAVITAFDTAIGTAAGPALAPFVTGAATIALTIPGTLPPGSYRIGWVLDSGDALAEFDEGDNTGLLAAAVTVIAAPDLVAEGLALGATAWVAGQTVAVSWTVRNIGGAAAPAAASALYLSPDPEITAADTLLLLDPGGGPLLPEQSRAGGAPFAVTVPGGLASGIWWLGALADPAAAVAEAEEGNNASAPVMVTLANPGQVLTGTAVANGIAGGSGDDTLSGLGGNDTLAGRDGADLLLGGGDDDRLFGEEGPDTLIGGAGFDTLFGNAGDDLLRGDGDGVAGQGDVLNGGDGADTLLGEGGADTLHGEGGADRLEGGPGFDSLNGGPGDDSLLGGDLRDTLDGGDGDDRLEGGEGNDLLVGGAGRDTLDGGEGPDFVDAGPDADLVLGGSGDDILLGRDGDDTVDGGAGADRILGGPGNDRIDGGDGADRLFGEAGDDTIDGGAGDDLLFGNEGDDSLSGGAGADTLIGEAGADTLDGGPGNDMLAGREGDDRLDGGDGDDIVDGVAGDDVLSGGAGADAVYGRAGNDRLDGGPGDDFLAGGDGADTIDGGPGADRMGGDGGVDLFLFEPGDGADLVFDFLPGVERIRITGGVQSFADLVLGTAASGWLTVGYSADPGDVITLQGLLPGDLVDDGSVEFL